MVNKAVSDGSLQSPVKKKKGSIKRKMSSTLKHLVLGLVGLCFLGPFAYLLLTSIKSIDDIFAVPFVWWPKELFLENYSNAVNAIPFFDIP